MLENEENLLLGQIAPSGDIVGYQMAEKGAKGDPGEPGEPGQDGQDGQAATIQVGTVTTGEPGTQAIVENVGTENEAIFNFTIPRGADGSGSGTGDMLKSVYDVNNNGIVDNAEKVNNHTVLSDVPSDAVFTDTTYTAGTGIDITNGVISNTQTSAEWGNITGTLSNQTDLQNALNSKANSTHTHSGNDITTGTTYYGTVGSGGASYSTVVFDNTINIVKGDVLFIKWNIAQTGGNLKMNTNGSPSIPLMYKGSQITDNVISVGDVSEVVYDGTYFQLLNINKWIGNVNQKQDTLIGTQIAGQNIKTVNNQSILGSGNLNIINSINELETETINNSMYCKCDIGKTLEDGDIINIKFPSIPSSTVGFFVSVDNGINYYYILDIKGYDLPIANYSERYVSLVFVENYIHSHFEINNGVGSGTYLLAVSDTAPAECNIGDKYYNTTRKKIHICRETNVWSLDGETPELGVFYIVLDTQNIYVYNGTELVSVGGGAGGGDSTPIGIVEAYAGETAPNGYLMCDGSAVSRTTYAELFSVIGTTYGSGDGSTTFNVPNIKGKVIVMQDTSQTEFDTLGETGGSKYLQEHSHTINKLVGDSTSSLSTSTFLQTNGTATFKYGGTVYTGNTGTGDSGNLQPYIVLNYIIKANKISEIPETAQVVNTYSESANDTYSCDYINDITNIETKSGLTHLSQISSKVEMLSFDSVKQGNIINFRIQFHINQQLDNQELIAVIDIPKPLITNYATIKAAATGNLSSISCESTNDGTKAKLLCGGAGIVGAYYNLSMTYICD